MRTRGKETPPRWATDLLLLLRQLELGGSLLLDATGTTTERLHAHTQRHVSKRVHRNI